MELNSKKLESTSRLIYYSISIVLCVFLVLLSNRIIGDLDRVTLMPEITNFENKTTMTELDGKVSALNGEIENINSRRATIETTISTAKENYYNEKQSFDNWVQTRTTLGSPDKDQEVIVRARKLDEIYKVEQDWRLQLNAIQSEIDGKTKLLEETQILIEKERQEAEKKYLKELKRYELKVFLIRLLFVGPVLAIGIFFIIRFRRHKFWPLFFGFSLFSFYAFFFGLVPYLPSYGGYVRYAVGIILSVGLGYYAIRSIRQFIDKKQAELKVSTQERAKNVQTEVAEKALENHFCPSCGKDFIIKRWDAPFPKAPDAESYKLATSFCRHCGLELFKNCAACGNRNFVHLPYCASCGIKTA
jgi:predicted RNA-binding Zn-ribbon protein involved in translation (DUF1610 family)